MIVRQAREDFSGQEARNMIVPSISMAPPPLPIRSRRDFALPAKGVSRFLQRGAEYSAFSQYAGKYIHPGHSPRSPKIPYVETRTVVRLRACDGLNEPVVAPGDLTNSRSSMSLAASDRPSRRAKTRPDASVNICAQAHYVSGQQVALFSRAAAIVRRRSQGPGGTRSACGGVGKAQHIKRVEETDDGPARAGSRQAVTLQTRSMSCWCARRKRMHGS